MSLLDRIKKAVEIVSADNPEGNLREQSEALLGSELDDETIDVMEAMAFNVGRLVFEDYMKKGVGPLTASSAAKVSILVAGMAVGKRLGAVEGEEFGRVTAGLREQ